MTSYLSKQHHSYSLSGQGHQNRKKIKHFSYSTSDRIGKGYSSVVYRGKNDNTDETVAIKAIDMKGVKDAVSREMLDCEIQALTKLKHPNILRCYEVIREPAHCYIITEFCEQGDLSSLLKKKRKMPESEVLSIMKDIVSGYLEIGQNKFLHRDLKLANILMNQKGLAKIADFGFAKKSFTQSEKEKYNVGSPLYMSPQALKRNIYSIKNDIWSIGIMVYEMLHGQTPWECKTEAQLIEKMTKIPVKFKSHVPVSDSLKDFILKCLQVNEARRMSLNDLKQWSFKHGHPRSYSVSEKHMPALDKRYSANENASINRLTSETHMDSKPLGDISNRISLGVQKNRSFSNVMAKMTHDPKTVNTSSANNKENFNTGKNANLQQLNKAIIDKNNTIILIEINKFRLMFKIYEKLKKIAPEEKTLHSVLGNEILQRVQNVADIVLSSRQESSKKKAEKLGIKQLLSYTNQQSNAGIKKYIAVVKEYQKKYKSQVETPTTSTYISYSEVLRKFLTPEKITSNMSKDENLLYYWILETVSMSSSIKKDELDSIIEGKRMYSPETLVSKLKQVQ